MTRVQILDQVFFYTFSILCVHFKHESTSLVFHLEAFFRAVQVDHIVVLYRKVVLLDKVEELLQRVQKEDHVDKCCDQTTAVCVEASFAFEVQLDRLPVAIQR